MSVKDLNALNLMRLRLQQDGGVNQQARMIKGKQKTLATVISYSYHGAEVKRPGEEEIARALINPNHVKQDYDEKIISIDYKYNYQPGDVFEWVNTGTKWLIYLQELTELSYFRASARKCSYEISWSDSEGKLRTTYAAIQGPQERSMKHLQKSGISMDLPNYTLCLLLPNKDYILDYFQRYSKFYLKGIQGPDSNICWRVEALDSISQPGILEVYATEYYSNEFEDNIEEGVVGGLIITPSTEDVKSDIEGESFIKPKKSYKYIYKGNEEDDWVIDNNIPIEIEKQGKEITIKWLKTYSGQFILRYGSTEKTIVVESLY